MLENYSEKNLETNLDQRVESAHHQAQMLDAIYDAEWDLPKEAKDQTSIYTYINRTRSAINQFSSDLNWGKTLPADAEGAPRIVDELNALVKRKDLVEKDYDRFRELYYLLAQRKFDLAIRLQDKIMESGDRYKYRFQKKETPLPVIEEELPPAPMPKIEEKSLDVFAENILEENREKLIRGARTVVEDEELYKKYQERFHNHATFAEAFLTAAHSFLAQKFLIGEYYRLQPDLEFRIKNENGFVTVVNVRKMEVDEKSRTARFDLLIFEQDKPTDPKIQYAESIVVDIFQQKVRAAINPEGVDVSDPQKLIPLKNSLSSLEARSIVALGQLLQVPKFIPVAASDKTIIPSGNYQKERPIEIRNEERSTLIKRERTITDANLESCSELIDNLINKWEKDERQVLVKEGQGVIKIRLFAGRDLGESGCVEYQEICEPISAEEKNEIREKIAGALKSGYHKVKMICLGSYVPREYKNLEPGKSPRAHFRRARERFVIVLPENAPGEIRQIQQRLQENRKYKLSPKEVETLSLYLYFNPEEIQAKLESEEGIYLKDMTFSPNDFIRKGSPGAHFIKRG